jgi:hypothetical protein
LDGQRRRARPLIGVAKGNGLVRLLAALGLWLGFAAAPVTAESFVGQREPTTVLVELLGNARMIGFPAVCPGSRPEDNQDDIICLAEMYEAPARVLRHIGGSEVPRRLNVRFTAHSFHAVWDKHVRFLLIVAPFEDKGRTGHFAQYWDWENERGFFCKDAAWLSRESDSYVKRLYLSRPARCVPVDTEDWSAGSMIHCIKGSERLAS